MIKYTDWNGLPDCCRSCYYRDSDAADEYSKSYHFCTKGLILPTKKGKCKIKDARKVKP